MRVIFVAVTVVLLGGCERGEREVQPAAAEQPSAAAEKPVTAVATEASDVQELTSPSGPGAAEPFLSSARGGVVLSWLEPVAKTDRVALRVSRLQGDRWTTPVTVVERNDLFVNWADFPSVVEDANGTLYVHWLQKSGSGTYAYDVQMSTSADGGKTWRPPFLLNRDGKQAEHGFVTLAALPGGGMGATWLDGRTMTAGGHGGHDGGDMTLRYATVSADGTLRDDVELDARTCECCTTGMAVADDGPVIVYRDRSPEEIRDISYVKRTAAGWSGSRPMNADGWKINACPVNGPQIDALGKHVATAWFTAAREKARAYLAFSNDGGATFGTPVQIDEGKPIGRVDVVMLDERSAIVAWLEQTPAGAEIRARRMTERGAEPARKIADSSTARAAGFPRMARAGRDVFFTWTEQDATSKSVRVARARF